MAIKKLTKKVINYLRELGKITPIAFLTLVMPPVGGMIFLMVFAYSLGYWLREHWQVGAPLFLLGVVFFCGLGILATNILGVLSGWAFGFALGLPIMMTGIVCAALLSFFISGRLVGDSLPHVFEKHPKAEVVYQALIRQSFRRTLLIIFLLRLSPAMPFSLTNFLMASARTPVKTFVIGTFFGMLPRTSAVAFVGSGLSELSFNNSQEIWLMIFGIVATIIAIIFISIVAKRALERLTGAKQAA